MSYKSLLVCLDERSRSEVTAAVAVRLAGEFQAQLIGAYLSSFARAWPAYGLDTGMGVAAVNAEVLKLAAEYAANTEAMFRAQANAASRPVADWLALDNASWTEIAAAARCMDLCVIGQAELEGGAASYSPELPGVLALGSGRPVLVVPSVGEYATIGEHVLIAWNGQREAARAVFDAIPFLDKASRVSAVAVGPLPRRSTGDELKSYLSYRGIQAEVEHVPSTEMEVGDLLLSRAADLGADLLVMGTYGHSRLRELVFGGVTRGILRRMTLPVLMSY